MGQNILVIGGNRFVGRRLVKLLNEAGYDVTVANRGSRPEQQSFAVKTVKVDRSDEKSMTAAFSNNSWDLVYDQVCYTEVEADIVKRVFSTRVERLIFTSTASVYAAGPGRTENSFDAESFHKDQNSEHDYQHGKRLAENSYCSAAFPVVAVRFPVILGVDDYKMRLHWHIERVAKQEPIYFPKLDARYSFIHADEAAHFLLWLASNKTLHGAVNACSPDAILLSDLMRCIEDGVGKKAIYAAEPSERNFSPFGIEADSSLSVQKAQSQGYSFPGLKDWLPKLVFKLCHDYEIWRAS